MITKCRRFLLSDPGSLRLWRSRFRAVLVDEFQDINREQYEILKLLSGGEGLYVVGDDDQSIYGFRGSSPSIMQQFMDDFPAASRVFLRNNYRCSGSVCKTAGLLIRQNKNRISKDIMAARPMLDKTVLRGFKEDSDEYRYLYDSIKNLPVEQLDRTAIIVRTNTHVSRISSYLSSHGISCRGKSAPSREILSSVIRDLEAYNDLAAGLKSGRIPRSALYRVMNRPERYLLRSVAAGEYLSPGELLESNRESRKTFNTS